MGMNLYVKKLKMENSNNTLDGEELLKNENLEVPFSAYWQKTESYLVYAYCAIIIALTVLAIIISQPSITEGADLRLDNILFYPIALPILFGLILYIRHFKKFRNRDLKARLIASSKRWSFFIITIILGICSLLLFLLSIVVISILLMMFFDGGQPDKESAIITFIYISLLVVSGFQSFYYFKKFLYLSKHNQLAKNAQL